MSGEEGRCPFFDLSSCGLPGILGWLMPCLAGGSCGGP